MSEPSPGSFPRPTPSLYSGLTSLWSGLFLALTFLVNGLLAACLPLSGLFQEQTSVSGSFGLLAQAVGKADGEEFLKPKASGSHSAWPSVCLLGLTLPDPGYPTCLPCSRAWLGPHIHRVASPVASGVLSALRDPIQRDRVVGRGDSGIILGSRQQPLAGHGQVRGFQEGVLSSASWGWGRGCPCSLREPAKLQFVTR